MGHSEYDCHGASVKRELTQHEITVLIVIIYKDKKY